jgi:hypothetical protein
MKKKRISNNTLKEVVLSLVEHPNVDTGNTRYLNSIEDAANVLKQASSLSGFGERAFGLAKELRQFHKLLKAVINLKTTNIKTPCLATEDRVSIDRNALKILCMCASALCRKVNPERIKATRQALKRIEDDQWPNKEDSNER